MRILACDPGNDKSAFLVFDMELMRPIRWWLEPNSQCRDRIVRVPTHNHCLSIEYTPPYVMTTKSGRPFVGNQVVMTAIEIGRFIQCWDGDHELVSRLNVKRHMLGRTNGNDAMVRQSILERYGGTRRAAVGIKKEPGPLYGVKSDVWAALAVAITVAEERFNKTTLDYEASFA